jgi:hypothetical protein
MIRLQMCKFQPTEVGKIEKQAVATGQMIGLQMCKFQPTEVGKIEK